MLKKTTSMSENKPVEETASEVEDKPVEETATVKTVKKSESGNILDIFNPHAKKDESKKSTTTAEAEDKSKPELPNILDIFKPKTDDGSSDDKTSPTKPADPNPLGGLFPQKNTDDKKTDVKPLFPSDDPFNIKKTFNDAQQALKEKGVGGLIQSVQQNVQQKLTDLSEAPEFARLKRKEIHELIGLYILSLINMGLAVPNILWFKINNAKMKDNLEKAFAPLVIKPASYK